MPQLPTTARDASYENPSLGVCLLTYRSCPANAPIAAAPGTSEWDRDLPPVMLVELRLDVTERKAERTSSQASRLRGGALRFPFSHIKTQLDEHDWWEIAVPLGRTWRRRNRRICRARAVGEQANSQGGILV